MINLPRQARSKSIASPLKWIFGGLLLSLVTMPPTVANAETKAADPKAELGRQLFFDTNLSEPAGQSCATCHAPAFAFSDPNSNKPTSKGVHPDRFGNRNTPSAMYMAASPALHIDPSRKVYIGGQFWDGRANSLEEQAKGPFLNPVEMANPDKQAVVAKVRQAAYASQFDQVFGPQSLAAVDKAYDNIAAAIAAFERTVEFQPFSSRYDAYLAGTGTLNEQELRGLALFESKGRCIDCHVSRPGPNGEPPLFTDFTYDNLGVPRNPENPFYGLPRHFNPAGTKHLDRGLGGFVNKRSEDGKFKVPTIRNIARTAPYMHNGYFKTLSGVVAFYNDRDVRPKCKKPVAEASAMAQGCWPKPEISRNLNTAEMGRLGLTDAEIDDIVAFMHTLNDQ